MATHVVKMVCSFSCLTALYPLGRSAKRQGRPGKRTTQTEADDQNDTEIHIGHEEAERCHGRVNQARHEQPGQGSQADLDTQR